METSSPGGPTPRSKVRSPPSDRPGSAAQPERRLESAREPDSGCVGSPPLEREIRRLLDKVGLAHGQGTLHTQNSPLGSSGPVYAPSDAAPARYRPDTVTPTCTRWRTCAWTCSLWGMRGPPEAAFARSRRPRPAHAAAATERISRRRRRAHRVRIRAKETACREDERSQAERSLSATSSRGSSLATRSAPASRKRSASAGSFVCGVMTCSPAAWSRPIAVGVIGRAQGWA